jgi:lipopolysaccharide exporter
MAELTSRVGKASLWVASSRLGVNLLGFAATAVLARLLMPADFGLVAIATAIHLTLSVMTELSMAQSLIAVRDPTREHLNTAWTLGLLRGLAVALLLAVAAPFLAGFFGDARLTDVLLALALSMAVNGMVNPRPAMLQKELVFWQDAVMQVSGRLLGLIAAIAVAWYYQSYWALVLSIVVNQAAILVLSYCVAPFLPRPSLARAREMLGFSVWLTLGQFLDTLVVRLDTVVIGRLLGPRVVGFFSVGENLASLPVRESTMLLYWALFPALAKLRDDPERLRSAYRRTLTLLVALALPIGVGMAVTADLMVRIMLGEKWGEAVIVVQAIALATAIQSVQQPAYAVAMATGSTRMLFWQSLALLLIRVPMMIAGVLLGGLVGVVWARLAGGVVSAASNVWVVRRITGLRAREQIFANWRSIASVLIMAAVVLALRSWLDGGAALAEQVAEMIASVALGALVYVASLFALWRLTGKPLGAEHEIVHFAGLAIARIRA